MAGSSSTRAGPQSGWTSRVPWIPPQAASTGAAAGHAASHRTRSASAHVHATGLPSAHRPSAQLVPTGHRRPLGSAQPAPASAADGHAPTHRWEPSPAHEHVTLDPSAQRGHAREARRAEAVPREVAAARRVGRRVVGDDGNEGAGEQELVKEVAHDASRRSTRHAPRGRIGVGEARGAPLARVVLAR